MKCERLNAEMLRPKNMARNEPRTETVSHVCELARICVKLNDVHRLGVSDPVWPEHSNLSIRINAVVWPFPVSIEIGEVPWTNQTGFC